MTTPTLAEITFDAETHTYWYGMVRVPSVTEIMRPLTEQYLKGIPEGILQWKGQLGTAVHLACELLDLGTLDEDNLDEQIVPYLEGYKQFLVDHRPEWTAIEERVFEPEFWYAGTLDRAGTLDGEPVVVDLKTSTVVAKHTGIQLWAYAVAHEPTPFTGSPALFALQLMKGDYKLHRYDDLDLYRTTWDGLLAGFNAVHHWTQENAK